MALYILAPAEQRINTCTQTIGESPCDSSTSCSHTHGTCTSTGKTAFNGTEPLASGSWQDPVWFPGSTPGGQHTHRNLRQATMDTIGGSQVTFEWGLRESDEFVRVNGVIVSTDGTTGDTIHEALEDLYHDYSQVYFDDGANKKRLCRWRGTGYSGIKIAPNTYNYSIELQVVRICTGDAVDA